MSKEFTDANWQAEVLETSKAKPVLVDFFASWCGPCQMQAPIIAEVASELGDKAAVGKLDTEANQQTAINFGVMSIPTLIIFKDGQEAKRFVGVQMKEELVAELQKLM